MAKTTPINAEEWLSKEQKKLLTELIEHELKYRCIFREEYDVIRNTKQLVNIWNIFNG